MGSAIGTSGPKLPTWVFLLLWAALAPAFSENRLLIMGPDSSAFAEVLESIREELEGQLEIEHRLISRTTPYDQFENYLEQANPKIMVLLDQVAIDHYRRYQVTYAGQKEFPPTIVSMAVYVNEAIQGMVNIAGVSYEVPAVTSFTNLRDVVGIPVERVGVVYRAWLWPFIKRQESLCKSEQIELVGYQLANSEKNLEKALKRGLRHLTKREKVDALWVLNDNALLSAQAREVWRKELKYFRKPVVVFLHNFVTRDVPEIGNFAVVPDHYGIGSQIADMALRCMENDWKLQSGLVEKPTAVHKILNVVYARKYFKLREEKLGEIDRLVD